MSAIGAIFNFNGAPVLAEEISALSEDLASRGPDGNLSFISVNVGMCYCPFHTTKESWQEQQPVVSQAGDILVMDGIIFNREELLDLLHDNLRDDHTDVGLMSVGLQEYGMDFLSKVVGNFAVVRYDAHTRTLFLARDSFGLRPIFYHTDEARIIVASDLKALLNATKGAWKIDDEYVASYLVMFPEPGRTPYKKFQAVEPGHVILAHDGHLKASLFWKPDLNKEIRYRNDGEYEEHLVHILRDGVRCCLRTDDRPVWSGLSGGLDSSSIVCIADQLIENREAEASRLDTFSIVFDESVTADERKFIRAVEEKRGRPGFHLSDDDYWMRFPQPDESFLCTPSPLLCVPGRCERLREEMIRSDARVLLNGLGGDHVFWNTPNPSPELADLLVQCRLLRLHQQLRVWSQVFRKPYLQLLLKRAILPFLPDGIRSRYQLEIEIPEWLDREFSNKMHLRKRLLPPRDPYGFTQPGKKIQSSFLQQLVWLIAAGSYQESDGIEMRSPFLHRPLVEFMLSIPFDQKLRPGEIRSLMRRALRNVLPEKILHRPGKGEISEAMHKGLLRESARLMSIFADSRVCSLGYANHDVLQLALRQAMHGGKVNVGALIKTISLEIWLRSVEQYGVTTRRAIEPRALNAAQLAISPHRAIAR